MIIVNAYLLRDEAVAAGKRRRGPASAEPVVIEHGLHCRVKTRSAGIAQHEPAERHRAPLRGIGVRHT